MNLTVPPNSLWEYVRFRPASTEYVSLLGLPLDQDAEVINVRVQGSLGRRLVELGLTPGAQVRVLRRMPLGGPVQLLVRGYALSMRRSEAADIWVAADTGANGGALGGQP
jgi:Fe2+ transport system protein FeoA